MHLKFKRTPRYGASRVLPRDAVRGRSVYLPRCKQVHGNRSVESPAPGETQPAASFRHGPSCRWDYPTPSWGGLETADRCRSSVYACVSVKKSRYALTLMQCRRRRTSSFLRCGPLCQGGTAAEPPLSLLCLPRCSECMEGDSCRPVAGGRGTFYPLTHLFTAFIALCFCFCTR